MDAQISSLVECDCLGEYECLVDALIGSKKVRHGARPTAENYRYLEQLVRQFTEDGSPIETFTMWGGLKAYGLFETVGPDLFDLMALRRLRTIDKAVREFYSPGVTFRIMREDLTEFVLSNTMDVAPKMDRYHKGLKALAKAMGLDNVRFENESAHGDVCERVATSREYATVILGYALEAEACDFRLDTSRLEQIGWKGGISKPQWEHYIRRTESELPNLSLERRKEAICLYLGTALARKLSFQRTPIKLALMPHPPGVSPVMYRGRIEFKIKDSKTSNNSVPPWAGYALVKGDDWSGVGVKEFRSTAVRRETVEYNGVPFDLYTVS